MCTSGLRISTSLLVWMSPAVTSLGPRTSRVIRTGSSLCETTLISLMLRRISVTSSLMLGIAENSWATPSMDTDVMAAPLSDESRTRRSELPSVVPKPGSSGSISNLP